MRDQLGKIGGGLISLGAGGALAYLITSRATGQPSPHLTWPVWPYYLCGAMFAVGAVLYATAHRMLPWSPQTDHALPPESDRPELPVAPAAVNPAEWKAVCNESGAFPDSKALTFGLDHRFDHRGAFLAFGALRCIVTDPDEITTSATGQGRYYQYTEAFFENAPPVRPGVYRFRFEGRLSNGEWVDIASGKCEIQGPPLMVTIMESKFENWRRIALIAALRVKVTNTTGTMIRLSSVGISYDTEGNPALEAVLSRDEGLELDRELHSRRERQLYGIPLNSHATVPAGESITGWIVKAVTRTGGGTPSCTVALKDELGNEYQTILPRQEAKTYR